MRRRWLLLTAVLCALLIATSLFASGTSGKVVWTNEQDGVRIVQRRALGFIPSTRREADASLHVSDDFRAQLKRLGLRLDPELARGIDRTGRQPITSLQWHYSLSGTARGSLKDAVDFYARQLKTVGRSSSGGFESLTAVCADGRSEVDVSAYSDGGRTCLDVGLTVLR